MSQATLRRGLTATVRTSFTTTANWSGNASNQGRVVWALTRLILEGLVADADELQALQALYTSTTGPNWTNHTNWPTTLPWAMTLSNLDFGTWFGVVVSNGDVTSLNLDRNQLNGTIPADLVKLAALQEIRLYNNNLSGYLPQALASLPLKWFAVSFNHFTSIPDFSGMPLTKLAGLSLYASGNDICFGPLEANFNATTGQKLPATYNWSNQNTPASEETETQNLGEPIAFTCSFSGAHNVYQWGKGAGNSWRAISGATAATYRINSPVAGDAGQYLCKVTNTVVGNLELKSPPINLVLRTAGAAAYLPPNTPAADLDHNWTIERTYDGIGSAAGNVLSESKRFTDGLGRSTQTQARNRANPHVFASETIYDRTGQPVVQTLAAPIDNQGFAYKEKFTAITNVQGNPAEYSPTNFEETSTGAPDGLDIKTLGTLGYYYSTANDLEPLTPTTAYPFSLTQPAKGPLGGVVRAGGPGETFRVGGNHEVKGRELPLLKEFDHYMTLRHHFVAGNYMVTLQRQGTKTVNVDTNGRESVVVTNKEGQVLVSCLSGTQYRPTTIFGFISTHPLPEYDGTAPRFLDIHIPATGEHELKFTLNGQVRVRNLNGSGGIRLTGTSTYLDSADVVVNPGIPSPANATTSTSVFLKPGFYRLVSLPSSAAEEQNQWFTYDAEYGNFNYTYYDDAGRAVATVAPNGLDNRTTTASTAMPTAATGPQFVTRNTYDTSNQLLASESTDNGRSEYVYARDGRIRFSQSALQRSAGRFSYSNYDELGRIVESGEYTPANAQDIQFQNQLPQSILREAEAGLISGGSISNFYPGGHGGLFVGNLDSNGSAVQFALPAMPVAGNYVVNLRYAAAFSSMRTMTVYANNVKVQQVFFPSTGSWSVWDVVTITLPLQASPNTVSVRYDAGDNGAINLDYLEVIAEQAVSSTSVLNLLEERMPTNSLLAASCRQRSFVTYDQVFTGTGASTERLLDGRTQKFINGAVTKTQNDQVTTWYSYNDQGHVAWMVQNIAGLGGKTLDYTYDIAGNVLEVAYQQGQPDAFHHYYEYDAALRLYKVHTSSDGTVRSLQAKYFYYLHGPLKRVELANGLQGVDYTYTLQGWLKSINHVNGRLDPGGDSPAHNGVAKDLFGLTLDYFSGDYQSSAQPSLNLAASSTSATQYRYDGTIRTASWRAGSAAAHQSVYDYDVKSQLNQSKFGALTIAGPATASTYQVTPGLSYQEGGLTYDLNGNIQALSRTDQNGATIDDFSYEYTIGTNRLTAVHGGGSPTGTKVLDYDYDAVGQMTRQRDEQGQRYYAYDVTGKTTGVYLDAARTQAVVEFAYDDRGFRIRKKSYGTGANAGQVSTTYYVRDAGGNLMSLYEQGPQTGNRLQRNEVPIYGTSRVGVLTHLDDGTAIGTDDARYELNDHLGGSRVVFHRPTTEAMETSAESTTAQQDIQWEGLGQARHYTATGAHTGEYVAYVPATPLGGRIQSVQRIVSVLRGDTVSFSAWTRIFAAGQPLPRPAGLRVLPMLTFGRGPAATDNMPGAAARPRLLNQLSAGLVLTGWGSKAAPAGRTLSTAQVWIRYRVLDEAGNQVAEHYEYYVNNTQQPWVQLQTGVRVAQAGSVEVTIGSDDPVWQAYFDDLRLQQTGGMIVQEQHQYAYGSPLVGLNYAVGNKRYRYGYQGQYAEKDTETGFESFELRLYNARIGRWMSNDPMGQFDSPYVGMGNNPISQIDPTGGQSGVGDFFMRLLDRAKDLWDGGTLGEVTVNATRADVRAAWASYNGFVNGGTTHLLKSALSASSFVSGLLPYTSTHSWKSLYGTGATAYGYGADIYYNQGRVAWPAAGNGLLRLGNTADNYFDPSSNMTANTRGEITAGVALMLPTDGLGELSFLESGISEAELLNSGTILYQGSKEGLTDAGQALSKHGDGGKYGFSLLPPAKGGNSVALSARGQAALQTLMKEPSLILERVHDVGGSVGFKMDFRVTSGHFAGYGFSFSPTGREFIGFLHPSIR